MQYSLLLTSICLCLSLYKSLSVFTSVSLPFIYHSVYLYIFPSIYLVTVLPKYFVSLRQISSIGNIRLWSRNTTTTVTTKLDWTFKSTDAGMEFCSITNTRRSFTTSTSTQTRLNMTARLKSWSVKMATRLTSSAS